eukprot:s4667_g4.t1
MLFKQMPHNLQQPPQAPLQHLLATGPVSMPAPSPSAHDREEVIREACKAHDIPKAVMIIANLSDDDGLQILPNVLEDLNQALQEVAQNDGEEGRLRSVPAENLAELAYQMGRIPVSPGQQPVVARIMQVTAEKAKYRTEELPPRCLSRMVWGFAGASARNDSLACVGIHDGSLTTPFTLAALPGSWLHQHGGDATQGGGVHCSRRAVVQRDSHVVIMQPDWGFFAAATSVSTWGSSWAGLEEEEEEVEEELF